MAPEEIRSVEEEIKSSAGTDCQGFRFDALTEIRRGSSSLVFVKPAFVGGATNRVPWQMRIGSIRDRGCRDRSGLTPTKLRQRIGSTADPG